MDIKMKKILNAIINFFKPKKPVAPIVVKPIDPIPEIPTKEEVENFPNMGIPDFFFADISHYTQSFSPKAYRDSFEVKERAFIIHKTTQGLSMVDSKWGARKLASQQAGLLILGYHFWECYKDPFAQAAHYVKNHGTFLSNPIFDFESIPGKKGMEFEDFVKDQEGAYLCLLEIERLSGKTPIIYCNRSEIERMKLPKKWARFFTWYSRYNSYLGPFPAPFEQQKCLGWQYKELGKNYTSYPSSFPGIGDCDCNIYYGSHNVLRLK